MAHDDDGGGGMDPASFVISLIFVSAIGWAAYASIASLFRDTTGVPLPLDPNIPVATDTPILIPQQ